MTSIKKFFEVVLLQPLYNLLMVIVFFMPNHSLGLAVIILTVAIRVALLPSTKAMTRQQALMGKLKPEIDALREKYTDKQEQAKKLMEFYKEHHINPAGSCLPMVLQGVILIVLYYVFEIGIDTSHFNLLYSFTPVPSQVNSYFLGIDLAQKSLWTLPIIAGIFQFIQTFQMIPKNPKAVGMAKYLPFLDKSNKDKKGQDPMAGMQAQMAFIMPLITIYIGREFVAALPLYWAISSLISIIQQHYVLKETNKITVKQADEISLSDKPEALLQADVKKNEQKKVKSKKGITVTVRQKKK